MARLPDSARFDPLSAYDAYMNERSRAIRDMAEQLTGIGVMKDSDEAPPDSLSEFRKPVAKWIKTVGTAVGWDDVIGNERARIELREAIEASTIHAETYAFYQMAAPKGVLLFGPPGCGKTMFAKAAVTALGGEEYILINGDELQAKYVGETEARIRAIFTYAREYKKAKGKPFLIFIDEAEVVVPVRGDHHAPWRNSQVAQFLTELDGLNELGAFIVLATNRPDLIDQALLRDGRISRKIKITRPDREAAQAILHNQLSDLPAWAGKLSVSATIEELFNPMRLIQSLTNPASGATHHFNLEHIVSGAMVVSLLERAKSFAFRRDIAAGTRTGVTQADMIAAVDELYEENKNLNHDYALREFVEDVALPMETLKQYN